MSYTTPPPYAAPQHAPAPKPRRRWPWVIGSSFLAFVLGLGVGAAGGSSTATTAASTPEPAPTVTVTAEPVDGGEPAGAEPKHKRKPKPAGPAPVGEGVWLVGEDIKPGTYRTTGPSDPAFPNCYWARLSGTSGEFSDVITNGNPPGPAIVTIDASDVAFETNGCKGWERQ